MKKLFSILILLVAFTAAAQLPPLQRDEATTNTARFFRKLQSRLGGLSFSTTNYVSGTNVNGWLKDFTWTTAQSAGSSLILSNVVLKDANFTNSATATEHALLSVTNNPKGVTLDNVTAISQNRSFYAKTDVADGGWRLSVGNSFFKAPLAFEAWNGEGEIRNSTFTSTNGSTDNVAFLANDDCRIYFVGCFFEYGKGTGNNYGFGAMTRSHSVFNACSFRNFGNSNSASVGIFEDSLSAKFVNCVFTTRTNPILTFDDGGVLRDGVRVEFVNSVISDPVENTVYFYNSNYVVHVDGGTFTPSMFHTQSNVVWGTRWQVQTNSVVVDTLYTNISQPVEHDITFMVTTSAAGDVGQIDLLIDQDGNNTWDQNIPRLVFSANADLNSTLSFHFVTDPGARYKFGTTNATGSSFEFISRQSWTKYR